MTMCLANADRRDAGHLDNHLDLGEGNHRAGIIGHEGAAGGERGRERRS